jgi:hypothetical protein
MHQTLIGHDTFCVRACTGDPQYVHWSHSPCVVLMPDTALPNMTLSAATSSRITVSVGLTNSRIVKEKMEVFQEYPTHLSVTPSAHHTRADSQDDSELQPPAVSNCNKGAANGPAPTGSDHKSAGAHESGNSSAHGSAGPSGSSAASSEEWLPVETCVPCAGAGSGAASSGGPSSASGPASKPSSTGAATPALSGTTEVGMSQLQTGGSLAGGASAISSSPTTAPKPGGDALVQKRQAKSIGGGEADAGEEGSRPQREVVRSQRAVTTSQKEVERRLSRKAISVVSPLGLLLLEEPRLLVPVPLLARGLELERLELLLLHSVV